VTYDERFFESIREGCQRSAAAVVPLLAVRFAPKTVVDVGCGEGWWGKAFQDARCEVLGLDGEYAEPVIPWQSVDLTTYGANVGTFDMAVCLEVAEHLPASSAADFVATLCELAPVVVFSAAVPGQGGTGHLNEQWPEYWADLFRAKGFSCEDALRWTIWSDERVEWWYRQNIFWAVKDGFENPIRPVIHPDAWRHHGHG
jgi:SAM-dependent methyltransferase